MLEIKHSGNLSVTSEEHCGQETHQNVGLALKFRFPVSKDKTFGSQTKKSNFVCPNALRSNLYYSEPSTSRVWQCGGGLHSIHAITEAQQLRGPLASHGVVRHCLRETYGVVGHCLRETCAQGGILAVI